MSLDDIQKFQSAMIESAEKEAIIEFTKYLKLIVEDPNVKFNEDKIKLFVRMDMNNYSIVKELHHAEGYKEGYTIGFMHGRELKKKDEN